MIKKIALYAATYLLFIIIFIITLTISSSFSSTKIEKNIKQASEILLKEGNRKIVDIPYRNIKMQFDNYTDALMLNTAYSIDASTPFYSCMVVRKNFIPGVTNEIYQDRVGELKSSSKYGYHNEVGELNDLMNQEKMESYEYARYWHGYLTVIRPLFLFFNLTQLRIVLLIILVVLAIYLLYLITKKLNGIIAVIFFCSMIWSEYFFLCFSLQGIFVFLIAMISSIVILERDSKIINFGLGFFIIGMLTNFFDFLTVPLITLFLPLILYFLLKQKTETNQTIKSILVKMIQLSMLWGIGYVLTWGTKWILFDICFNRDLIKVALQQVFYRSAQDANITWLHSIISNLQYWKNGMICSIIISVIAFNIQIIRKKITLNQNYPLKEIFIQSFLYIIIGLIPIVWYAIIANHSYYHAFFTYRNLMITNICINITWIKWLSPIQTKNL